MSHFLQCELTRYQRTAIYVAVTATVSLLAALYFFAIIGRFDHSPGSAMFRQYNAVFSLALTVALCVIAIHGSVIYARFIVADYIGNHRIQLYSYPGGRRQLFLAKNAAYTLTIASASAAGLLLAVTIFFLSETIAPIVDSTEGISWANVLASGVSVVILAVSVALIAGAIGIWRQSVITAIVSVIVVIAVLGNGVASSLNSAVWLTWLITAAGIAVALILLVGQAGKIRTDEVL
ncbi:MULTISPECIES: ABC transporter permease [unclassified Corynebacterium]|uniref:ABC transporter permease n=1 Tax=unclassified Corynebacterium TaxID=2624378 RepID=UPI0029C9DF19|nr:MULTISPECIES: ABC transporter permease [unclassified Corynebacterium]WPF65671.1 ABC transporter permease [Corynebacterium sp. 22KM0430]WPF68167.1 ABC transporter permease [Corynebacterium sp. 21KM1197]